MPANLFFGGCTSHFRHLIGFFVLLPLSLLLYFFCNFISSAIFISLPFRIFVRFFIHSGEFLIFFRIFLFERYVSRETDARHLGLISNNFHILPSLY